MQHLPVFIHIPKTAGSAFRSVIERNVPVDERIEIYRVGNATLAQAVEDQRHKLPRARIMLGHFERRVHDLVDRPVAYFTILRDPVERVLSLYKYIKVDFVKHPLHARFASGEITFEQWIARRPPMASNVMTKMVSGLATEYEPSTPAMLPVAIRALHDMAAVGIQERFNESVDAICQALGWTPVYVDRNRSSLDNRAFIDAEKISDETMDAIRAANELDAALYAEGLALLDRPRVDLADPFEDEIGEDREAA
jgi:hypothetical protein